MILIVTYDLKGPAGSYGQFYEALKNQGAWWHYLKSTWLISTDKSPNEVFTNLREYINSPDHILIAEMGSKSQGWLPKDAWDWIHKHKEQGTLFSRVPETERFSSA